MTAKFLKNMQEFWYLRILREFEFILWQEFWVHLSLPKVPGTVSTLISNKLRCWSTRIFCWWSLFEGWRTFQPRTFQPQASTPDLSTPDFSTPDFSTPDFSTPDFSTMNFPTPDFSTPYMGLESPGLRSLGLKSSWLKSLGLKGPELERSWLKSPGLKLGVEKSGIEMSFNHLRTGY